MVMNFGLVAGAVVSAAGGFEMAAGTGRFVEAALPDEPELAGVVVDPLLPLLPQPAPIMAVNTTTAAVEASATGPFGCFMFLPSSYE
jgi:hypothetical protein